MAQTFEERVEEVLGELHGMAWPLLEEPQKRKIVGKVARGIDKGDSIRGWGRALGVAEATLRGRLDHFRRSEPIDGASTARAIREARAANLRYGLKDPEVLAEVMRDDPAVRRSIAKAAVAHQADVEAAIHAENKRRAPGLTHRAGFNDVAGDLLRVRQVYAKALETARTLDLDASEADALLDDVTKIAQITGWFESWLSSGADDFDTELERILEG